ncbi:MAG: hypothetical protein NTW61_01620 [Candidatus Melainabacteria bacterium]|jgi:hypothetical protein|nr:hypothetical protein [Candidatus Melainabacteria bacterium]
MDWDIERKQFDGLSVLEEVLATSEYGSVEQAVASLCVFSHPATVKQLNNTNLFRIIRYDAENKRKSCCDELSVLYDDNYSPTCTFLWANGLKVKGQDVQFNHLYADSKNVALYTNLCNIVMTPTFIAKLTDKHSSIPELLKYRAFKLYGFDPENKWSNANSPQGYEGLKWADPLPPVENAEKILRAKVENSKEYRLKTSVEKYGWYFSGFQPIIEL